MARAAVLFSDNVRRRRAIPQLVDRFHDDVVSRRYVGIMVWGCRRMTEAAIAATLARIEVLVTDPAFDRS